MNHREPATAQIEYMKQIELRLRADDDLREQLNGVIFSTANKLRVRPSDLAFYLVLRTVGQ